MDARTDVYASGCVVYEMAPGRAPFDGETPQALAKQPADRFQTASAFAEALTAEMVVARVGRRRWSKRVVVGAVVSVVLVVAWGLSTLLGGPAYERLAVLPPTNLMNDPEQEYFVQGMHIALMVRNPHWFAEVSSLNSFEARLGEHH